MKAIEEEAAAEAAGPESQNLGKILDQAENEAQKDEVQPPVSASQKPSEPELSVSQAREMAANMQAEMIAKTSQVEKEAEERAKKASQ